MRKPLFILAALLLAAVTTGTAAQSAQAAGARVWRSEPAMLASAKAQGVVLGDGSAIHPVAGFCHGIAPYRGSLAQPLFYRFRCTLVTRSSSGTAWYDVRAFPLVGMNWAVVLHRY